MLCDGLVLICLHLVFAVDLQIFSFNIVQCQLFLENNKYVVFFFIICSIKERGVLSCLFVPVMNFKYS